MARHIPASGPIDPNIVTPLTLTQMQRLVGAPIRFVELLTGDILIVRDSVEPAPLNSTASAHAGKKLGPIYGDAILCSYDEIA